MSSWGVVPEPWTTRTGSSPNGPVTVASPYLRTPCPHTLGAQRERGSATHPGRGMARSAATHAAPRADYPHGWAPGPDRSAKL
jgi:hypothetical protein